MSVLKGEGTTLILYGTIDIPLGARSWTGYLARPDGLGEWPTVVVVPGARGLSGSLKALCRRVARHGIAAIAADPFRSRPSGGTSVRRALVAVEAFGGFIGNPTADWSNAGDGFGVLGLDDGAATATVYAGSDPAVLALALVDPPLAAIGDSLRNVVVPVLGTAARSDADAWDEDFAAVRAAAPQAEWALYSDAGFGFWDADRDDYDDVAATDSIDRVIAFFGRTLPPKE